MEGRGWTGGVRVVWGEPGGRFRASRERQGRLGPGGAVRGERLGESSEAILGWRVRDRLGVGMEGCRTRWRCMGRDEGSDGGLKAEVEV